LRPRTFPLRCEFHGSRIQSFHAPGRGDTSCRAALLLCCPTSLMSCQHAHPVGRRRWVAPPEPVFEREKGSHSSILEFPLPSQPLAFTKLSEVPLRTVPLVLSFLTHHLLLRRFPHTHPPNRGLVYSRIVASSHSKRHRLTGAYLDCLGRSRVLVGHQ
jgi:hypothetical protein